MEELKSEQKISFQDKFKNNVHEFKVSLTNHKLLYLLIVPFILWYAFFMFKPMYGLQIAFKDYDILSGIKDSNWLGLGHFKEFLNDTFFWRAFRNTIVINMYDLIFGFPAPIIVA